MFRASRNGAHVEGFMWQAASLKACAAQQHRRPASHPPPSLPQVVTGKQWVLEAVGEIVLRGWREATGPCAAAIEATLIQARVCACACAL